MRTLEDQSGGRVALAGTKDSLRVICVIGSSHVGYHGTQQTQTQIFSLKWLSDDVVIPDRRILSGRVLNCLKRTSQEG